MNPECRRCGVELIDENWSLSDRKCDNRICKECHHNSITKMKENTPSELKAMREERRKKMKEYVSGADTAHTLSCLISSGDLEKIDWLIISGIYLSRGDILRTALRNIIRECGE